MPYIKQARKSSLQSTIDLEGFLVNLEKCGLTSGEVNYLITRLCLNYLKGNKSYQSINDIVGALECAKLELYRRFVAPYEDMKKAENGDVF